MRERERDRSVCYHKGSLTHLLRQQEVGQNLQSGPGVDISVQLHQGLRLVVGQPDGGDALQLHEGDGEVGDVVPGQGQHGQLRHVANLVW